MNPRNPGGLGVGCAQRRVAVLYALAVHAAKALSQGLLLRGCGGRSERTRAGCCATG